MRGVSVILATHIDFTLETSLKQPKVCYIFVEDLLQGEKVISGLVCSTVQIKTCFYIMIWIVLKKAKFVYSFVHLYLTFHQIAQACLGDFNKILHQMNKDGCLLEEPCRQELPIF